MTLRVAMCLFAFSGLVAIPRLALAQEPPLTSGVIAVPGAELPYLIEGEGMPCLVYGSPVYYPRTLSPRFKAALRCAHVAERGFVPGAGRRNEEPFGVLEAVRDIEAARQQLGMDHFVLVGHSIHGLVVLAYAALHAEHVSHVIAIGAPPGVPMPNDSVVAYRGRYLTAERQAQHDANRKALDSLLAAHPGRAIVGTYIANGGLYWADPTFDSTPLWEGVEINDTLVSDLQRTPFAFDPTASKVQVPIFVALGRHDYVVPPNVWGGARTPFSRLTVRVFERAGHTPQFEDPDEFDSQILGWLGGGG